MKKLYILFFLSAAINLIIPQQKLTLEDIFSSAQFTNRTISGVRWLADGTGFTFIKHNEKTGLNDIWRHIIETGDNVLLVDGSLLTYDNQLIPVSDYFFVAGTNYLLIRGLFYKIWRYSSEGQWFFYNIKTKDILPFAEGEDDLRNVKVSPDTNFIGYVNDSDIYIEDNLSFIKIKMTDDGSSTILNGEFDWVYEEEFGISDGLHWSPDSRKIAFWRFDQSRVKEFFLIDELGSYNQIYPLKYPKAGEQNSAVRIGVTDINTEETAWIDIGHEEDIYIPRIYWTNSPDTLAIVKLKRDQKKLEILLADVQTGKSKVIITDSNRTWVDVEELFFPEKSRRIIMLSERSGFSHIYIYDYEGNLVKQVTGGNWEVTSVIGIDEENEWIYFYSKKDSPLEKNIYRVKTDGKSLQRISEKRGWHKADFSPGYKYFIDFYSDEKTPPTAALHRSDGSMIRFLEENNAVALKDYSMTYPEFGSFRTSDGTELNYYLRKPADFDSAKKYPVIVFGYGGPGSQNVVKEWEGNTGLWHQYLAEQGYIIFSMDNRGTGGRGKEFKNLAYGDISRWMVNDHIEGVKFLAGLPYADTSRIGVWGWSGGGYLALMLMTRGADFFKAGVAVAPVSDPALYDAIWTERYMGHPHENQEGYRNASALNYAHLLRGKLLIIHGTADDNVHLQNTLQMVNELQANNRQFDLMLYPNRDHSISGGVTQLHLFTAITEFFLKNL